MPVRAPIGWVTGRSDPALELVERGVRTQAGAVLIGPAGVGKSTLARHAAEQLSAEFVKRLSWHQPEKCNPRLQELFGK